LEIEADRVAFFPAINGVKQGSNFGQPSARMFGGHIDTVFDLETLEVTYLPGNSLLESPAPITTLGAITESTPRECDLTGCTGGETTTTRFNFMFEVDPLPLEIKSPVVQTLTEIREHFAFATRVKIPYHVINLGPTIDGTWTIEGPTETKTGRFSGFVTGQLILNNGVGLVRDETGQVIGHSVGRKEMLVLGSAPVIRDVVVDGFTIDVTFGKRTVFGDANDDGLVTGADMLAVQQNFGRLGDAYGLTPGDANNDGRVSGRDVITIMENFGNTSTFAPVAVPEPSILLCAMLLLTRHPARSAARQRICHGQSAPCYPGGPARRPVTGLSEGKADG
jgi:hypothetical protein